VVSAQALRRLLPNDRQLAAYRSGAAGLDQGRGAAIELAGMPKDADDQNKAGAHQANDHDLQMGLTISAIDRMIHMRLRLLEAIKRNFAAVPVIYGTKRRFRLSGLAVSAFSVLRAQS
jgi:hypothetical protein